MTQSEIAADIDAAVLCWLATVDVKGRPNVSPKEIFALHGDVLVIADIASANSVRNIRRNPAVCASMIDIFRQKGRKVEGQARIIAPGDPEFADLAPPLLRLTEGKFPIRHVIAVQIERVSPILAPSYRHYPDCSEAEMMQSAYRTYGVAPTGVS